ncbi:protein tyrosine phosphatase [Paenibacillus sp. J5C_2022]|uniref:tyrosine-protein phosphatase n=1 Tax=Paenibacillus sp. J5C2022 TaxID=2977129 RepID=UPI0021CE574F|nr:CpsB/CapC family capsule biosynthesis tyrosine phosphatase [Paenibacillus sp. J5C2022]MCU6708789.1 protein tyrosine phosphatase [Paenibacillus sp. J5C2022]
MIDIHTHILPGIDDGASTFDDTLQMAQAAYREGISTIIATPHHANGKYMNLADDVRKLTAETNERLRDAGVPVSIACGQEIRVHDDLLDAWHRAELLTLADSAYLLLEMPSSRVPSGMEELVHELHIMGVRPIIAHPERNADIVRSPEALAELVDVGAYAQVTTHSLLGGFGKKIEHASWTLMKRGLIHLLSSDAHHVERRGFRMQEAYEAVEARMGREWVDYLQDNARQVMENGAIAAPPAYAAKGAAKRLWSRLFG